MPYEQRCVPFPYLSCPEGLVNLVHAWPQAMLTMTSIIRVGQSKFVSVPIDEDSQERIFNCIRMLGEMSTSKSIDEIFLLDTKAAYAKMVATEEVCLQFTTVARYVLTMMNTEKSSRENRKGAED